MAKTKVHFSYNNYNETKGFTIFYYKERNKKKSPKLIGRYKTVKGLKNAINKVHNENYLSLTELNSIEIYNDYKYPFTKILSREVK